MEASQITTRKPRIVNESGTKRKPVGRSEPSNKRKPDGESETLEPILGSESYQISNSKEFNVPDTDSNPITESVPYCRSKPLSNN